MCLQSCKALMKPEQVGDICVARLNKVNIMSDTRCLAVAPVQDRLLSSRKTEEAARFADRFNSFHLPFCLFMFVHFL